LQYDLKFQVDILQIAIEASKKYLVDTSDATALFLPWNYETYLTSMGSIATHPFGFVIADTLTLVAPAWIKVKAAWDKLYLISVTNDDGAFDYKNAATLAHDTIDALSADTLIPKIIPYSKIAEISLGYKTHGTCALDTIFAGMGTATNQFIDYLGLSHDCLSVSSLANS
jgi:hypothetical protein